MKEEISSLVKESLKEQDEVEDDEDVEDVEDVENEMDDEDEDSLMGDEDEDEMDFDTDNEEDEMDDEEEEDSFMMGDENEDDMSMDSDEDDTIDLTGASDAEVLRVFKAMGDNDGVIVKQDDNMIHLSDNENDTEYLIQLGESDVDELYGMNKHSRKPKFSFDDDEEMGFEDEFEEDLFGDMSFGGESDVDELYGMKKHSREPREPKFSFDDDEEMGFEDEDEVLYELTLDTDEFSEGFSEEDLDDDDDDAEFEEGMVYESKKGFKTKGVGMGSASKYKMSKKPNMDGGFKTIKKKVNKTMGTGKAKFEYKETENFEGYGKGKVPKKTETKEAARTYGNGSKEGRGLRKGITPNRNLTFESAQELEMLRAKNEEYRKALDLFRTKLNEVAVFNSNLAYATRLFTEHSTTKQEKINILRRFDNAETLKESKTLYKVIKDELGNEVVGEKTISESIERTVSKSPVTGSAVNLIESKTYENPQFLRMKDLMGKLK